MPHLYGFDRTRDTLTPAERQWLTEFILRHRWTGCPAVRDMIRDAADYGASFHLVHLMFIETWSGGADPDGLRYQCNGSGVEARMPSGNQGRVTWREIIDYARAEAVQPALF